MLVHNVCGFIVFISLVHICLSVCICPLRRIKMLIISIPFVILSDINISGFGGHIVISGYRSLSQSLGDTFIELAMIDNPSPDLISVILSEI